MEKHLNHAIESVKDLSARVQVNEMNKKWDEIFDFKNETKEELEKVEDEEVYGVAESEMNYKCM